MNEISVILQSGPTINVDIVGTGPPGPPGKDGEGYELPVASAELLGGIKVGENLTIDSDGVLSIDTSVLRAYVDEAILGGAS